MPVADILIEGEIGWDVTLRDVRQQFFQVDNPTDIVVHINSIGGEVDEGFAIHDFLRAQGLPVTTIGEGAVYSIATVILLAGDKRQMSPNANFMVHNPWAMVVGDADEMERYAAEMRRREAQLTAFYSRATGQSEEQIREWMRAETFFSAEEAVSAGFATEVYEVIRVAAKRELTPLKAVAKFVINDSDMSAISNEDRTLIQDFVAGIKAILQPKPKAEAEVEPTPAPEPEAVEDQTPDYAAQISELTSRIDSLEAEKNAVSEKLEEAKSNLEEKEEQLTAVMAKVKELESLPLAKAEPITKTTAKEETQNQSGLPESFMEVCNSYFNKIKR